MEENKLREYQERFVNNIRLSLFQNQKIIACMATGGGKTIVFLAISQMALKRKKTVLIITESTKIFPQIANSCKKAIEINAGIKNVPFITESVYVAMAQTLLRRSEMIDYFGAFGKELIIITDEAHIGTPTKLLSQFPNAYHIGFTATPDFRAAKHLPILYNDIVIGSQPSELVESGYLASYTHLARTKADLSHLQKNSMGDFSEHSQELAFEKPVVYEGLINDLKTISYKKCLIFTASIGHCERLTEQLNNSGFCSVAVHSLVSSETINLFTEGEINICVSVGMLTKGFDYPIIDLIILQRATTSLPLYLQMCGRASRISSGKTGFTVLDYGENYKRHQLWIMDRDWSVMWKGKLKEKEGVAPIKDCPACGYLMPVNIKICPGCGHVFEPKKNNSPEPETELVDVTKEYNLLKGRKISSLTPKELVAYVRVNNKKPFGLRIAKAKYQSGQKDFLKDYAKNMGYKPGFLPIVIHELANESQIEFHDITIR